MNKILSVLRVRSVVFSCRLVLIASLLLVLTAVSGSVGAAEALGPDSSLPDGKTIPYSGTLSDASGQPVAGGLYTFRFSLYAAPTDGQPLWSEEQPGVAVQAGAFQVSLGAAQPLPSQGLGKSTWLSVSVRGPDEAAFTALEPRQQLNTAAISSVSAPSQAAACAHDHLGERWETTGLHALDLRNTNATGSGLIGVQGPAVPTYLPAGVNGYSWDNYGVAGGSQHGSGLFAWSNEGIGIKISGSTRDISAEGSGIIYSVADTVLELSPQAMVQREDTASNISVHPVYGGAMRIDNDSGTGLRYVNLPVQTPGILFGSRMYIKSIDVCYKAPGTNYITTTAVAKSDGTETGEDFYILDGTDRTVDSRFCYSVSATPPLLPISSVTWVQFNLQFNGATAADAITIYRVDLTLSESDGSTASAPEMPIIQPVAP